MKFKFSTCKTRDTQRKHFAFYVFAPAIRKSAIVAIQFSIPSIV